MFIWFGASYSIIFYFFTSVSLSLSLPLTLTLYLFFNLSFTLTLVVGCQVDFEPLSEWEYGISVEMVSDNAFWLNCLDVSATIDWARQDSNNFSVWNA